MIQAWSNKVSCDQIQHSKFECIFLNNIAANFSVPFLHTASDILEYNAHVFGIFKIPPSSGLYIYQPDFYTTIVRGMDGARDTQYLYNSMII